MLALIFRLAGPALFLLVAGCSRPQEPLFPHLRAHGPPEAVDVPVAKVVTPSTTEPRIAPEALFWAFMGCSFPRWPSGEGRRDPCEIVARHVGFEPEQLRNEPALAAPAVESAYRSELFREHLSPLDREPRLALCRKASDAVVELRKATDAAHRIRQLTTPPGASAGLYEEAPMSFETAGAVRALAELWAFGAEPSSGFSEEPPRQAAVLALMVGAARLEAANDAPPSLRLALVPPTLAALFDYRAGPPTTMEPDARWFEYLSAAADALAPPGWLAIPRYVPGQGHARELAEVQAREALSTFFASRLREAAKRSGDAELREVALAYAESLERSL